MQQGQFADISSKSFPWTWAKTRAPALPPRRPPGARWGWGHGHSERCWWRSCSPWRHVYRPPGAPAGCWGPPVGGVCRWTAEWEPGVGGGGGGQHCARALRALCALSAVTGPGYLPSHDAPVKPPPNACASVSSVTPTGPDSTAQLC